MAPDKINRYDQMEENLDLIIEEKVRLCNIFKREVDWVAEHTTSGIWLGYFFLGEDYEFPIEKVWDNNIVDLIWRAAKKIRKRING